MYKTNLIKAIEFTVCQQIGAILSSARSAIIKNAQLFQSTNNRAKNITSQPI